jgi:hypothetical protein
VNSDREMARHERRRPGREEGSSGIPYLREEDCLRSEKTLSVRKAALVSGWGPWGVWEAM